MRYLVWEDKIVMRIFRALPSLVVFLIVTACSSRLIYEPHRVDKHSEVGSFQISATLIAPWDEFVADLSPEFDVTEQIALAEAIPRTSIIEKQILNSLAAALKIAPSASPPTSTQTNDNTATGTGEAIPKPTVQMLDRLAATRKFAPSVSPPTSTQTNIHILNAGGTTKETGESTKTKGAGDESNVTDASAPVGILLQSPATKLPSDADNGPGIDPFLKYTAATALYQEVKILNRYIQSAARRHHMVPYLVRLQMTNTPFARHQPYDTYVTVSFFSRVVCERYEKNADGEYKIVIG